MRLVVDSNQLQCERLRRFLAKSPSNFAVLTDYAAMEAYKGDTLKSIYHSMAVLGDFPRQILVLRGTAAACGMRGRQSGLQRRLTDELQTAGFPEYIRDLRKAKAGDRLMEAQLLEHGRAATDHLDRMLLEAGSAAQAIGQMTSAFTKEERRILRVGEVYSAEFVDKTVRHVMELAGVLFQQHPNVREFPNVKELPNTFIFRASLCLYLLALDWSAHGGANDAKPGTLRNDIVDMNFAAFATYFDGLMSIDGKARRIHNEARVWLGSLFDAQLPSGWKGFEFN